MDEGNQKFEPGQERNLLTAGITERKFGVLAGEKQMTTNITSHNKPRYIGLGSFFEANRGVNEFICCTIKK